MLEPSIQAEILRLFYAQNLSRRQIAKKLSINRITVRKVINRGSVCLQGKKRTRRATILEPYLPLITTLLQEAPNRSAVNILQHLRPAGYTGSISTLRLYLQSMRPGPTPKVYTKLTFHPGEAAQVDWGEFGDVFGNGTKVHVFVMVLCWSRMLYLEFTQRETLPTLLRCYERAVNFFGGVCKEYWHDNMPTVVVEHISHLVRFTNSFLAYAGFRHFKPIACNPGAGNEKGRVEDGVKLIRNQFWPGRNFKDMVDLNQQAIIWRDTFANRREHATTKKVPELLFAQEKQALLPLSGESYDTDEVVSAKVSKFHRVRFEGNTYTVPWTMVGKTATIRADDTHVLVYYCHKRIAKHQREYQKGKDIIKSEHQPNHKSASHGANDNLETVKRFGPHTCRYLELIAAGNRSIRTEVKELLCLSTVYGIDEVEKSIASLLEQGIVGVAHLERTLRLNQIATKAPPPLEFKDKQLQFVPPKPQLESYDAILIETHNITNDEEDDHYEK